MRWSYEEQPRSITAVLLLLLTVLSAGGSPLARSASAGSVLAGSAFGGQESLAPVLTSPARTGDGYLGVAVRRAGTLSAAQTDRAAALRDRLPAGGRDRLDAVLAAAAPEEQGYLAAAFAAGHPVAEVASFAATIAGRSPYWLRSRLRPVAATGAGAVRFRGNRIGQYNDTTCGSTVVLAARMSVDPLYALYVTTGGRPGTVEESDERFLRRLREEEQRIHDETDVLWPQVAGTPPWGLSERLNRDPAALGGRYRWRPALPVAGVNRALLRQALTEANRGFPVPMLIGDLVPRHYVLLLRHDDAGAWFYEPTAGEIVIVPGPDLERRDFDRLGYPRLAGVILPSAGSDRRQRGLHSR
ncbi:hypothetical protein [Actinoplanes sp. M2I2]|uniref:hypothetical protein n=1 Tax=Actinoplanes sp. M2I2 TaxID=1734444 RepID=UPI002020482D|nr:hypothetical protein [Actinoplanes sp. M2I2]